MKIAVYTCSLNEESNVEQWAASSKDADYRLVMDTGSTDKTVPSLIDHNVAVGHLSIRPWRFDDARNATLHLLPNDIDVAIQLDMDERLTPNWRHALELAWKPGTTRLHYKYIWSWSSDGRPDRTFYSDKISGRHTHRWKNPVHEVLVPTIPEHLSTCTEVLIEHHPDNDKSRAFYLPLLEQSVKEDPLNDRNSHYLGRQYFYEKQYDNAINEFRRHLMLPTATWPCERCASLRYGAQCYEQLGNLAAAHNWYVLATLEDLQSREALVDTAKFLLNQQDYQGTLYYANKALMILSDQSTYINERYALEEGPYDLASIALFHLGQLQEAHKAVHQALSFSPNEQRLLQNLKMIEDALSTS